MYKTLFLYLFLLLFVQSLWAQKVVLSTDSTFYPLGYRVEILEDKQGDLTLEKVLLPENQKKFKRSEQASPNQGYSASDYWFRIAIKSISKKDDEKWLLRFHNPHIDTIQVYFLDQKQKIVSQYFTGDIFPFAQRPILHPQFLFPIPNTEESGFLWAYIKLEGVYSKGHNLDLITEKQLILEAQYSLSFLVFLLSILFALALYNTFLYISIRDVSYLYYVLYLLCVLAYLLSNTGLGYQFIYPQWARGQVFFANFGAILGASFASLFTIHFLKIKELLAPWILRGMHYLLYYAVAVGILTFYASFYPSFLIKILPIIATYVLLSTTVVIILGVLAWRKGSRPAQFFLLAWISVFVGTLSFILRMMGIVESNLFNERGIQIGMVLEALLLSFGLADRIKIMENEKRIAQQATIAALKANEQIIKEQNQVLEQRVEERTQDLAIANQDLATFNEELNQTNEELNTTLELVSQQKTEIELKNKSITDSIIYAKRIQESILPTTEELTKYLPEYFVIFEPRDIVSGDFYYLAYHQQKIFIAVIDCTGHGVPGALMSMLGKEVLDHIILENQLTEVDDILNELDKNVRKALKQEETNYRDGMDIALCSIDMVQKKIAFAGAYRPLIYFQNNELFHLKGDRHSIGGETSKKEVKNFSKQMIDITSETTFYLFSDGWQDQFGGKERKKYGLTQLKEQLQNIYQQPMKAQTEYLKNNFKQWMNEAKENQIDDVLLLGFRVVV